MVCEMETHQIEEMEFEMEGETLSSMWPEDIGNDAGKQFNVENPGQDEDMLKEVTIVEEPTIIDFKRLSELTNYSEKGSSQLAYLVKNWEYKQANAVRLLKEELDSLSKQRQEAELKELEILEEHRFEPESYGGDKRPVSILDEVYDIWPDFPRIKNDFVVQNKRVEIDAEYDTVIYWKQRAMNLEKLLEASTQREQILMDKLQESITSFERQSSPVEELSQILKRADNFLHFVLQNAPVVIGHQDKELRYRFIYNHFPSFKEEDIIGRTDVEIFTGSGVKESQDFKREVLEKGKSAKREITFETELFGSKTFLIYVEPVFSKLGETIGINYMGMDVTDQVIKREKMIKLREEIAVQKAKETELNKTIHITEETMRAKQMLATMSHEIRSPLSGVVSMAEILSTTKLDKEQRQLLDVMISSGDLVLQLINDILDLSKVESGRILAHFPLSKSSPHVTTIFTICITRVTDVLNRPYLIEGVMKLESTKFRPREVVRHVLQTAAASLQKILTLEGRVADDVPVEVVGDVLRIRQILTNLISNAIKFTHEGKVGIKLYVVPEPSWIKEDGCQQNSKEENGLNEDKPCSQSNNNREGYHAHSDRPYQNHTHNDEPKTPSENGGSMIDVEEKPHLTETTVWICCDVKDTGIGIPENALPTLFKRYMQVSADHARKYGGTGLGLAICKQLVELMGGRLTVSSQEHHGSTFTFILPYKVSDTCDHSDDSDELTDMSNNDSASDCSTEGFFQFQPRTLGSLFTSNGTCRTLKLLPNNIGYSPKLNAFPNNSYSFACNNTSSEETVSFGDAWSAVDAAETSSEPETSLSHRANADNSENVVNGAKQSRGDTNNQIQNYSVDSSHVVHTSKEIYTAADTAEPHTMCQIQEKYDSISHCNTTSSSEETNSTLNPKILLVEDNKINVMVTRSMMKQLGYSIDVVNNGVEAVRAIQRHNYGLVLMDVCMPVMDGLQATRLIRSFEETGHWNAAKEAGIDPLDASSDVQNGQCCAPLAKRTPIIAMTANALSESAEECYGNGMDSFVSKPVTFRKLKQCLDQYLS